MGALSVVISAMLASIFLNEKLTFFGWLGCSLCIVRHRPFVSHHFSLLSFRLALSSSLSMACPCPIAFASSLTPSLGPQEQTPSQITKFESLFLAPSFLAYIGVLITIALSIIIYFGPKFVLPLLPHPPLIPSPSGTARII